MQPTVTLETICWELDWRQILGGEHLRLLAERNPFPFSEKILMINNVRKPSIVARHADRAVQQGWITKYIVVAEHAAAALEFFAISRESLGVGYYYSIAEFVALFLSRSDFHLYYTGDCLPVNTCDWVSPSLRLMAQDSRVKVCNTAWDDGAYGAKNESTEETADFYLGQGFSDQCYLVRTEDFRRRIYNESHPASARYPSYGGEPFEKRVDAWMRNHGHLRLHRRLSKLAWYRKISQRLSP